MTYSVNMLKCFPLVPCLRWRHHLGLKNIRHNVKWWVFFMSILQCKNSAIKGGFGDPQSKEIKLSSFWIDWRRISEYSYVREKHVHLYYVRCGVYLKKCVLLKLKREINSAHFFFGLECSNNLFYLFYFIRHTIITKNKGKERKKEVARRPNKL